MRKLSLADALREAMIQEMRSDPRVILMGEDVGPFQWGIPRIARHVRRIRPHTRLGYPHLRSRIYGNGNRRGFNRLRPIIEFQYADFMYCAMDQIVNEAAKLRLMSVDRPTFRW